ncbi:hypothetical protein H2200_000567 [Cladophialophora chaetospira]|uniref:Major facilitator superfamily (MFS) profile domain-containing protein n=1 Tax=Cladophialophora chaetospira TaxID=386627 RepID=A0AA38XNT3_9EURO|nr:hypothetical protein H2200_000567 [Cladophialophora chaetospira]
MSFPILRRNNSSYNHAEEPTPLPGPNGLTRPILRRNRSSQINVPGLRRDRSAQNYADEHTPLFGADSLGPEAAVEDRILPSDLEQEDSSLGSEEPTEPDITFGLTVVYALASGFTTANLYYCQPILDVLAAHFNVTESEIANLPALAQAGNALGLLTILPVADFMPKRKFLLVLLTLLTISWLGLCLSKQFTAFLGLTFLTSMFIPVVQLLQPLVSELSTEKTRAFNIAIMANGPTLGIFVGRVISGVIADHTTWRNVYWMALAIQSLILVLLFLLMPDYDADTTIPTKDLIKKYPNILSSILTQFYKKPALVQISLLAFCSFFAVTSFWTTVTFLLSGPPYDYNSSQIGLLGFIGLATMLTGPLCGRFLIPALGHPLVSIAVGKTVSLIGVALGTFLGTYSIAGPVLQAVLLDMGLVITQISNRVALYPVAPESRNRVNSAFTIVMYLGQLAGTKAGSAVYVDYGGWLASGGLSMAVLAAGYIVIAAGGPNEQGWLDWHRG